jgi:hypothetical protein
MRRYRVWMPVGAFTILVKHFTKSVCDFARTRRLNVHHCPAAEKKIRPCKHQLLARK